MTFHFEAKKFSIKKHTTNTESHKALTILIVKLKLVKQDTLNLSFLTRQTTNDQLTDSDTLVIYSASASLVSSSENSSSVDTSVIALSLFLSTPDQKLL